LGEGWGEGKKAQIVTAQSIIWPISVINVFESRLLPCYAYGKTIRRKTEYGDNK